MNVARYIEGIIAEIEDLKKRVIREEEEVEYKNWIEGILSAAIAALKVVR